MSLRWLLAAFVLCAAANADLFKDGDVVEPGYPFGKHCSLTVEQEAAIRQDSLNHFKANDKGYCYEAFPHSKVPTSSCFVVILAAGVSLIFVILSLLMRLVYTLPIFHGTTEMRKTARSNLRIVGFLMDKKDLAPPEDPENVVPLSPEAEAEEKKSPIPLLPPAQDDPENYGSVAAMPFEEKEEIGAEPIAAVDDGGDKKKDKAAVHAGGSIVPVLRNEDPTLSSSDGQSDDEGETDESEPNFGKYRNSLPVSVGTENTNERSEAYLGPSPSYTSDLNGGGHTIQPSNVQRSSMLLTASSSASTNLSEKPDSTSMADAPEERTEENTVTNHGPHGPPSDTEVPHYVP